MSEERTEAPTPKRRKQAREEGRVARSPELIGSLVLLAGLMGLRSQIPHQSEAIVALFQRMLASIPHADSSKAVTITGDALRQIPLIAAPGVALTMATGLGVNIAQVGFQVVPKLAAPKWERINPASGVKRLVSAQGMVELLKAIIKFAVIGLTGWNYLKSRWTELGMLAGQDPHRIGQLTGNMLHEMAVRMVATLAVLSLADYAWQRYQLERSLKMTKQEIRDEMRETEASPELRQRQRQRQRELSRRRMMADVPNATVVLMNPTHYAVALRYEIGQTGAPRVIARGRNLVALKIRALAEKSQVPVVENPPLARALWSETEIGDEVPAGLYRAVAEVLAVVLRLDRRQAA